MPSNKSSNKVRVTRLFGTEAAVGLTEPKVNMQVKYGTETRWIKTLDTDHGQVGLALASGGAVIAKAYPHDLTCSTGVASYFGWPAAGTDVTFGHHGVFPNGIPTASGNNMVYQKENDGPTTFYR